MSLREIVSIVMSYGADRHCRKRIIYRLFNSNSVSFTPGSVPGMSGKPALEPLMVTPELSDREVRKQSSSSPHWLGMSSVLRPLHCQFLRQRPKSAAVGHDTKARH